MSEESKQNTAEQQFHQAIQLHQTGRLADAKTAYERIIAQSPLHFDAMQYLGILMCQIGRPDTGAELISNAIKIRPDVALYHNNLGIALKSIGKLDEAASAFRRSIEINPIDPMAHSNLGDVLRDLGQPEEAAKACRRAIELKPDYAEAYNNLGNALKDLQLKHESVASYRRAAELKPSMPEIQNNLGNALLSLDNHTEAALACRRAIQLNPSFAQAYINLGTALREQSLWSDAIAAYRRGVELRPDLTEGVVNLANALSNQARIDEAKSLLDNVKMTDPTVAKALMTLGYAFACQGMLDHAIDLYRRAVVMNPDSASDHSFLVYSTNLHPAFSARQIFEEASAWANRHAKPIYSEIRPHTNDQSPDRKLKIGYLSPDYRDHVLGWFMPPILEHHDRTRFEVYCFSVAKNSDDWTEKLRRMADHWYELGDLSDPELVELIRNQKIDILVDQAVHLTDNRLLVFARQPAPVQVSYLAYFGTTGMQTMDYLLCDPYMELMGDEGKHSFSEKIVRLPRTYWCYRPQAISPGVGPLPAIKNGHVTFGCLNNVCKLNQSVWDTWCRILKLVPHSRLIVHAGSGEGLIQMSGRVTKMLQQAGIDPARVELVGRQTVPAYLATYKRIDIALDPFPYTGGATSCDALWMGVPLVSIAGKTSVSRGGNSLLSNLGLQELVAESTEQYVQISVKLAFDLPCLKDLHDSLRQRMRESPLMDEAQYVADLEAAYRIMWERWCGKRVTEVERSLELLQAQYLDDAEIAGRKAIEQNPGDIEARVILGNVYKQQGLLDQSIDVLREMVKLDPTRAAFHSNLVFEVSLHPAYNARQIYQEAREWSRLHADRYAETAQAHSNDRSPGRKLKIGYVSPDFTGHPVGRFIVPMMTHHDRQNFEIHCFANITKPDNFTPVFRQVADHWHDIVGISDDAAAKLIRDQEIDILVDLALHTADNRLPIFARKPAPVQATYLAYCGTSGMNSIDYLLCDRYLIPAGDDQRNYAEQPLRLPGAYWCYRAPNGAPELGELPSLSAGHVTFGCLNNFSKVTPQVLDAWCKLLLRLPTSRLCLHAPHGSAQKRVHDQFAAAGVNPFRIRFIERSKFKEYLGHYLSFDIALDTFPFCGGTTTCDALWMGVPTITLAGQTSVSRGGLSILSAIGLGDLVAHSVDQYTQLAVDLAVDVPRLKGLHDTLRQRMMGSPLMDEKQFVADLESAYRSTWNTWCISGN